MSGRGLVACRACNRHAFESEARCPHCGASLRTGAGTVLRTAAALAMGLGVATFSGWACAAYGIAVTGNCDTKECGTCVGCATEGTSEAVDQRTCASSYEACVGPSGTCDGDGDPACCAFVNCLDECGGLDGGAAAWSCICGSSSYATCAIDSAAAGTCVGEHRSGAAVALGPSGWIDCALGVCDAPCGS